MRHKVSQEVKQNIVDKNVHFTLTFNLNISKRRNNHQVGIDRIELVVFYMTHRVWRSTCHVPESKMDMCHYSSSLQRILLFFFLVP